MSPPKLQDILQVYPATDFECAGRVLSKGRRCSHLTNRDGRHRACELLAKKHTSLRAGRAMDQFLDELAPLLLCTRHHQDQASNLVEKWKTDLDAFRQSTQTTQARRLNFRSSRASEEDPATRPALDTASRSQGRVTASWSETTSRDDEGQTSSDLAVHRFMTDYTERADRAHIYLNAVRRLTPSAIERGHDATPRQLDELRERMRSSFRPPLSDPSTRHKQAKSRSRSRTDVSRQPIEAGHECGICLEFLLEVPSEPSGPEISDAKDHLVWCRKQCGNSFHAECLIQWFDSCTKDRRETKCPSCRTKWSCNSSSRMKD